MGSVCEENCLPKDLIYILEIHFRIQLIKVLYIRKIPESAGICLNRYPSSIESHSVFPSLDFHIFTHYIHITISLILP